MATSPAVIRSTTVGSPCGPGPSLCLRTTDDAIPLRRSTSAVPAVATISKPRSTSRLIGKIIDRLSRLATETNTVPEVGRADPARSCDLAKAVPKSASMPITSPVDRISGPRIESTACPVCVRKRRNGRIASLTLTGASCGSCPPSA